MSSVLVHLRIETKILTGKEIDELNDYELSKKVEEIDIFARMNPMQKERGSEEIIQMSIIQNVWLNGLQ